MKHTDCSANRIHLCHLVGAGPGDPELLTIKAVRVLRRATVVLVDDLVDRGVLRWVRRSARIIEVGKRGGCRSTPQAFIEKLMISEVLRGERVVRLKGGDPLLFGRAGEEIAALSAHGIGVEVVNGVTAGLAAGAALGSSLTHRDCAHGVLFVTGHAREDSIPGPNAGGASTLDWTAITAAAASGVTLVIYMGLARIESIGKALRDALPASTPVAWVAHASAPDERRAVGTLDELEALARSHRIESPAVLLVGRAIRSAAPGADAISGWPDTRAVPDASLRPAYASAGSRSRAPHG